MDTTNIVYYMGASFIILALLRFMVQIEPIFILCYSFAGLIFLFHEIWYIFHEMFNGMTGKNIKRSFMHRKSSKFFKNKRSGEIFIYGSMLAILFLPHVPYMKNMKAETITTLCDFMSLFALGLTLVAIGFKQMKPADEEQVKRHLIELPDSREALDQDETKSG
ncbi:hypothetical protein [Brevibacillus brevis]|uniref:hypothetical protein n=1 Tax=Brevibacillus brevis TaxID=1393 RepID=UPI001156F546|nr:hypothetical protein [Lysinibacillus sp. SDF0063]TQR33952.1 hypothetical protein C7Y45_18310 [Lysinibacillus sp. SDF0063]